MIEQFKKLHPHICKPGILDELEQEANPEHVTEILDELVKLMKKGENRWSLSTVLFALRYFELVSFYVIGQDGSASNLSSAEGD